MWMNSTTMLLVSLSAYWSRRAMVGVAQREKHRERRSLSFAAAMSGHAAAVELDEVTSDRQAKAEPAVRAR